MLSSIQESPLVWHGAIDTLSFVATGEELDGISFSFDEAVLVSTSFRVRTGVRVRGFSSTRERLLDGDSLPSSD